MESKVSEAARILSEIETLKATRSDLDNRISALEAQLRHLNPEENSVVSCPSISTGFGHGLSPDMIYRYSRHLLLPSFGVQGSLHV